MLEVSGSRQQFSPSVGTQALMEAAEMIRGSGLRLAVNPVML